MENDIESIIENFLENKREVSSFFKGQDKDESSTVFENLTDGFIFKSSRFQDYKEVFNRYVYSWFVLSKWIDLSFNMTFEDPEEYNRLFSSSNSYKKEYNFLFEQKKKEIKGMTELEFIEFEILYHQQLLINENVNYKDRYSFNKFDFLFKDEYDSDLVMCTLDKAVLGYFNYPIEISVPLSINMLESYKKSQIQKQDFLRDKKKAIEQRRLFEQENFVPQSETIITKSSQLVLYLSEIGLLNLIIENYKAKSRGEIQFTKLAQILKPLFKGINSDTLRKLLNDLGTGRKNDPLNKATNVETVSKELQNLFSTYPDLKKIKK